MKKVTQIAIALLASLGIHQEINYYSNSRKDEVKAEYSNSKEKLKEDLESKIGDNNYQSSNNANKKEVLSRYNFTRKPLQEIFDEYQKEHPEDKFVKSIIIEKGPRVLTVYVNNKPLKSYRIALSGVPGDKVLEGDMKTPEGEFFVERKRYSNFDHPLIISYPLPEDAERGLKYGIIKKQRYREIINAHKECKVPPQRNDGLGSNILIHGGGGYSRGDWTAGCIALNNSEKDELYQFVEPGCHGTSIVIVSRYYDFDEE